MKKSSPLNPIPSTLSKISLWVFWGLLAYMPLHIFLSTWFGTTLGLLEISKVLKDIIMIAGFVCALGVVLWTKLLGDLLRDKLVWIIGAYAALTVLLALVRPTDQDAEILGVVYNLRFLVFFLYGALLVQLFDAEHVLRRSKQIVMAVALPVLLFGIFQYALLPDDAMTHVGYSRANGVLPAFFIDDKPDLERVMSTLRDPNSFGSYIIIILSIALAYFLTTKNRELKKITTGFTALSLLALWYTFSRSAWVGAFVAICTIGILHLKNKRKLRLNRNYVIGLAIVFIVALAALIPLRNTYFVQNVIFHADSGTAMEDPNELRQRFWQESAEASIDVPAGHGPGTAGLASIRNDKQDVVLTENYYLQLFYEVGFIGLGLFLAILVIVFLRLFRKIDSPIALALFAAGAGLLTTNFLVHIWANEAVAYTWWGLISLVCFKITKNNKL